MKALKLMIVLFIAVGLSSCAGVKNRELVCSGLLQIGIPSDAFKQIWGLPTRTKIATGDDIVAAGWGRGGGSFFKGKAHYEVWSYEERGVDLAFNGRRLAGWNTQKTLKELDSSSSEACKNNEIWNNSQNR